MTLTEGEQQICNKLDQILKVLTLPMILNLEEQRTKADALKSEAFK